MAQKQGNTALEQIAYGGRAQVRAALGKWADAVADAGKVPTGAKFEVPYAANPSREWNWLVYQSHTRFYFSVYGTWAEKVTADPRVPWRDLKRIAVDGKTPMYQQLKYTTLAAPIQLMAGDEMRLIEAEAALRLNNDVAGALGKINGLRSAAGQRPAAASTVQEAFGALRLERDIVLWMEGRRLWELRRFDDAFLANRDKCIPASENEVNTNPNLKGS